MDTDELKSGYAEIEGVRLFYKMAGEGPKLVLVHAGCADRRMWDKQIFAFAQRYRVLRYGMRGYGNSALTRGPFSKRSPR
jgi:3-oxoadipate enol-lactonase